MEKEKKISMQIVNPNAAGIDIGSRSHFVAIGQGDDDVKEFGVYNEDLTAYPPGIYQINVTNNNSQVILSDELSVVR